MDVETRGVSGLEEEFAVSNRQWMWSGVESGSL